MTSAQINATVPSDVIFDGHADAAYMYTPAVAIFEALGGGPLTQTLPVRRGFTAHFWLVVVVPCGGRPGGAGRWPNVQYLLRPTHTIPADIFEDNTLA
jgi:hypothetical protein